MSTPQEFRAWFEGFTESIEEGEAPTRKQWDRIKNKVKEIYFPYTWNQTYYYPVYPYSPTYPYPHISFHTIDCVSATYTKASSPDLVGMSYNMANNVTDPNILGTNSLNVMYTKGKNDYSDL